MDNGSGSGGSGGGTHDASSARDEFAVINPSHDAGARDEFAVINPSHDAIHARDEFAVINPSHAAIRARDVINPTHDAILRGIRDTTHDAILRRYTSSRLSHMSAASHSPVVISLKCGHRLPSAMRGMNSA